VSDYGTVLNVFKLFPENTRKFLFEPFPNKNFIYILSLKKTKGIFKLHFFLIKNKTFVFFLETDLPPKRISLVLETFELKVTMFFTLFIATHTNIITSDLSNLCHHKSALIYRTFCYHLNIFEQYT